MQRMIVACDIDTNIPDIMFTDFADPDEFAESMFEIDQSGYDDYIMSQNDDGSIIELYKSSLESMLEDRDLSKSTRKMIYSLLEKADPDQAYIHVELREAPVDGCQA